MANDWHDNPAIRVMLRLGGAALLGLCGPICVRLTTLGHGHAGSQPASVYLLALLAFACFASGGALLFYGHHLFDHVGVSPRWAARRQMRDE